jgi:hypothetical protein
MQIIVNLRFAAAAIIGAVGLGGLAPSAFAQATNFDMLANLPSHSGGRGGGHRTPGTGSTRGTGCNQLR